MRTAKFLDIIKSFSNYLRIDNLAGYKEVYTIDDLSENDLVPLRVLTAYVQNTKPPVIYNLPAGSETPIIINFAASTIKIGAATAVAIGTALPAYQANPTLGFEIITSANNTTPKDPAGWIVNKVWSSAYSVLTSVEISPDPDPEDPTITADNINIIIKA